MNTVLCNLLQTQYTRTLHGYELYECPDVRFTGEFRYLPVGIYIETPLVTFILNNIILKMDLLPSTFRGTAYRLANVWFSYIPQKNEPIRYLEIGAFYGANILSVAASYAKHPDSVLVAVDPWVDYSEYPEYKGQQETIYDTFQSNIETSEHSNKIIVKRGYSHEVIPTFEDSSFDIIYIDGNHEPEYVLEDAVIAFRKLKVGGYMVFDDYGWGGPDLTQRGIDSFLKGYYKRIKVLGMRESQVFIQKTR